MLIELNFRLFFEFYAASVYFDGDPNVPRKINKKNMVFVLINYAALDPNYIVNIVA